MTGAPADGLGQLLEGVVLFNGLGEHELQIVADAGQLTAFAAGAPVFARGDPSDALYLVVSGSFDVVADAGEPRAVIASLGPGSPFGEMGVVSGAPRNAGVVCRSAGALFVLAAPEFARLASRFPALAQAAGWVAELRGGALRTFEEQLVPLAPVRLPGGRLRIGRDSSNDLVLDAPGVAPHHAEIYWEDEAFRLRALSGGVFIGRQPIEDAPLHDGDIARAGSVRMLCHDGVLSVFRAGTGLRVDCLGVSMTAGEVRLVQEVTFSALPAEFVALVGASGAGKSTLMRLLLGLAEPGDGEVRYDGRRLTAGVFHDGAVVGYVPQDELLHRELPVEAALSYSAELRLPRETTAQARRDRVAQVMETLSLTHRAGIPINRLSGGERRRVSIAVELLANPGLLFLDEATSGLDPATEAQLMREFRRLADDGHTIVLVTHATRNVRLCDQVAFLAPGGRLAYFGPPAAATAFFDVAEFDAIYERVAFDRSPAEWAGAFDESADHERFVTSRLPVGAPHAARSGRSRAPAVSWWRQFWLLTRRSLDIQRRDRTALLILLLLGPAVGLLNFIAWPRDVLDYRSGDAARAMTLAYLYSLAPVLLGTLSVVRDIVKERAIYGRERMIGLSPGAYVASKVTSNFAIALYHAAALFVFLVSWVEFSGLGAAGYAAIYLTLLLAVFSGMMWGLLISAFSPREEQTLLLAIGVVLLQIVFSGGVLPLADLGVAGTILGGITTDFWSFSGVTSALEISASGCAGEVLDACRLPGFGAYGSDAEGRVAFVSISNRFGDILTGDVRRAWAGLAVIITVCIAAIWWRQRTRRLV
ncbi:MAG: ATP-binding cassette domain-containing protein [Dehalococcoidia bacterium]